MSKDTLLLLLAMGGCVIMHLFMHKANMGKSGHNHNHNSNDSQKISQCKEHQGSPPIENDELIALDKVKSKIDK